MSDSFDVSASALRAARLWMDTVANNMANSETTAASQTTENGYVRYTPYRRKTVLFFEKVLDESKQRIGVEAPMVADDHSTPFIAKRDPNHDHAVKDPNAADYGVVYMPNINPIIEMTNMISASRFYEANVTAIDALKSMNLTSMRIIA